MALNALVDSFCHNQKKCGTERIKLTLNVMDRKPHLFHSLPLSLLTRFLHRYQLILLCDRSTRVRTTCRRLLRSRVRAGVEPATSRSFVRLSTRSATASLLSVPDSIWSTCEPGFIPISACIDETR